MLIRRTLPLLVLALALAASTGHAAKRLGGGGSIGRQSSNVTQREAARPSVAPAPAQQQAAPAAAPSPTAPAPAPRRPWGGLLGGLAAGLGLAWLANALGLGPAFGGLLMVLLLVAAGVALAAALSRSRRAALQPAGLPAEMAALPRQYSPDKVGNDASARPWEQHGLAAEPGVPAAPASQIGAALPGGGSWAIPAGFDVQGFVANAKQNFMVLQEAWDRADLGLLRAMMTDGMLGEIKAQLAERERQPGAQPSRTEVHMLQAQLLGIEDLGSEYLASVEFSGMVREDPSAGPSPFREVWNMSKPKDGASGWLVAGVQALQ
ncbi:MULTISPECIES: Tim44-like domain-containing protein [Ramlibacter]|uniref:Tim44 domain-containing protein n=1 Tax=Ramlibacter aquaticus TaxID=2780094 RepID=A0ABR9SB03_9BURK|nr:MULTISPECIES: Tim44-like domain-containing protein [Ramlibacter]MBE7939534.1 Tim44 domain-containing protein [Ramlibacter aquaticus]